MSYTMLLADDSATTHRVMELTFAGQDIQVVAVADGEQAVERMRTARPDILVAEVALPRVDGYKLSEHVRSTPALSGVPVLLLTGAFDVVDEPRVRACGAGGIIVKPFEPEVVIRRVKELLGISAKEPQPTGGRLVTLAEPPQGPPSGPRRLEPQVPAQEPASSAVAVAEVPLAETRATARFDESAFAAAAKLGESTTASADDYLNQLDAAFSSLDQQLSGAASHPSPLPHTAPAPAPSVASAAAQPSASEPPVFEIDQDWFGGNLASPSRALTSTGMPNVADTFQALLAAEQGEAHLPPPAEPVVISDEAIERIATRVAERLTEGVFVETVTRVVENVAERLVREEIARIRARVEARKS